MPPIGEMRVKDLVGQLSPTNLAYALQGFGRSYYRTYIESGSAMPIFHGAVLLNIFNFAYHRPHEGHYYEQLKDHFVIRTGIEDGFTVVGMP